MQEKYIEVRKGGAGNLGWAQLQELKPPRKDQN